MKDQHQGIKILILVYQRVHSVTKSIWSGLFNSSLIVSGIDVKKL